MVRQASLWLVGSLALGCATQLPPPVAVAPAPSVPPAVVLPAAPPELIDDYFTLPEDELRTIRRANRQARVRPTSRGFQQGMYRFPYKPFSIYVIATAVDTDTNIVLAPGERLIYFSTSDTSRWKATETYMGEGETQRVVVIMKPTEPGLRTTATMTTPLGLYRMELVSNKQTYLSSVSWKHTPKQEAKLASGEPSSTRYQMRILANPMPSWTPVRVWDTSIKTYIQVDEKMRYQESPLIFAKLRSGLQRVNHRLKDPTTFELDKIADTWQMQFGPEADGQIIQIERIPEVTR